MKKVKMELGGNGKVIVEEDDDIDNMIKIEVKWKLRN